MSTERETLNQCCRKRRASVRRSDELSGGGRMREERISNDESKGGKVEAVGGVEQGGRTHTTHLTVVMQNCGKSGL